MKRQWNHLQEWPPRRAGRGASRKGVLGCCGFKKAPAAASKQAEAHVKLEEVTKAWAMGAHIIRPCAARRSFRSRES